MNSIKESLDLFSVVTSIPPTPGDHVDAEGFLVCGTCGERKQQKHSIGLIRRNCACERTRIERDNAEAEARRHKQAVESIQQRGRIDPAMRNLCFSTLDDRSARVTETCRSYVAGWGAALRENYGILFFGTTGTGKSHHAYAIANGIAEKEHSVFCGTVLDLISAMQDNQQSREKILHIVKTTDLLLLDDFGATRYTDYQWEQVYSIINARYNARKPTIITTNLSPKAMEASTDEWMCRVYSRIKSMCAIHLRLSGEDRRTEEAAAARAACLKLYL